jgi:hypothetical protein
VGEGWRQVFDIDLDVLTGGVRLGEQCFCGG